MKQIHFGLLSLGLFLSGCSVMHFKNGSAESSGKIHEAWHHNVAYSLLEVSPPIDLKTQCEGRGWTQVTTQETLITGLAGAVDEAITGLFVPGGINIWDPQFIQWTCSEGAGAPASNSPAAPADTAGRGLP